MDECSLGSSSSRSMMDLIIWLFYPLSVLQCETVQLVFGCEGPSLCAFILFCVVKLDTIHGLSDNVVIIHIWIHMNLKLVKFPRTLLNTNIPLQILGHLKQC